MEYELAIADRLFSSWSLRGWLMLEKFGLPVRVSHAPMDTPEFARTLDRFGAARLVPAMAFDDVVVWDSLAMAETLAERHPDIAFWPADARERGLARAITAEMHAGFTALREACPMNLTHAYRNFAPSKGVVEDLARIAELWALARDEAGDAGPWLFGTYSLADVFYAPVAARIAGYGLPVPEAAQAYVTTQLSDPAIRRWRAMGVAERSQLDRYGLDLETGIWPGPAPLPAEVSEDRPVNAHCPYSGKPVAQDGIARIDGVVVGFCNRFCRDKTIADAEAWPEAMALVRGA